MKRNLNLVSLSREHHYGLLFCWKLKQGVQKQADPGIMRSYVRYFWEKQLKQHFTQEDTALGHLLPADHEMQQRLELEHRQVEEKVAAIMEGTQVTADDILELAEMLIGHIRFEERVFFPLLEQSLLPGQLEEIGRQLPADKVPEEDDFTPAFWARDYVPELAEQLAMCCLVGSGNKEPKQ